MDRSVLWIVLLTIISLYVGTVIYNSRAKTEMIEYRMTANPNGVVDRSRVTSRKDLNVWQMSVDPMDINKPVHPLAGVNMVKPTAVHDPLVNQRHYLPHGHLQKHFDMSDRASTRKPLMEQSGLVRGIASDQPRDIQMGIHDQTKNDVLNAAARDKIHRAPQLDSRTFMGGMPSMNVINNGAETGVFNNRTPTRTGLDIDTRERQIGIKHPKPGRGIKTHDWSQYSGLANTSSFW